MRLTIRLLGAEVFHLTTDAEQDDHAGHGDVTTYPVGFTPPHEDQRWEPGGQP